MGVRHKRNPQSPIQRSPRASPRTGHRASPEVPTREAPEPTAEPTAEQAAEHTLICYQGAWPIRMLELLRNARKHQDRYLENEAFPHFGTTAIVFIILLLTR